MIAKERLAACKAYLRVDFDSDDGIITALLSAADDYVNAAGVTREMAPEMFDLITFSMALQVYDGRDADTAHAAASPVARMMLNQLKLRAAFASKLESEQEEGETDDNTSSGGTDPSD